MENLAPRMRARHGHKLPRSVEPHGFVPQGSKVAEIPAGSTTKIKDGIRRVALYRVEECRVVLVDIVVSRAVPESLGKSIVIRDRRVREAPNLLRVIPSGGAAHRPPMFSYYGRWIKLFGPMPPRLGISVQGGEGSALCCITTRRRVPRGWCARSWSQAQTLRTIWHAIDAKRVLPFIVPGLFDGPLGTRAALTS